jgi:predicted aspartyl protease
VGVYVNSLRRLGSTVGVIVLLAACATAVSQPTSDRDKTEPEKVDHRAKKVARLLKKRGYAEVPLVPTKIGLADVKVEVDGVPMLLILDTGSNYVSLDRSSAKRAKLALQEVKEKTSAIGGSLPAEQTNIAKLSIGELSSPGEAYVVDFSATNDWRKRRGDPPCDGVLGGRWLAYYSAIIDYAGMKLYLLDPAREAESFAKSLKRAGYVEVPLQFNDNGLLDVKVRVNATRMLLFVDSGLANATISLDRPSAKKAQLEVKEKGNASELGGSVTKGWTKIDRLSVGGFTSAPEAEVRDYSFTNATRKAYGAPSCDGSLGADFLKQYSAVIDYPHEKLYLLDRVGK